MDTRTKIVSEERAHEIDRERRAVWIAGCFDPMVAEQARLLRKAAEPGRALIVEVTNPPAPLLSQRARAELVAALAAVDYVVMSDRDAADECGLEITQRFVQHLRQRVKGGGV